MTNEEKFINDLEGYLGYTINDYGRNRIVGYVKDYGAGLPPVIVEKIVVKYRAAKIKYVPQDERPILTEDIMEDYAQKLCEEYSIDYGEFRKAKYRKSRAIIADIRRIFSRYMLANYKLDRKQLENFFSVDHTTICHYLNNDKFSQTITKEMMA